MPYGLLPTVTVPTTSFVVVSTITTALAGFRVTSAKEPLGVKTTPRGPAPTVLESTWQTRAQPSLFFAGQVSGVEGYVESAASGLIAGLNAGRLSLGLEPQSPPRTTAIGALAYYASQADPAHYDPSNITFGIMPPLEQAPRAKHDRQLALSARALQIGRAHV